VFSNRGSAAGSVGANSSSDTMNADDSLDVIANLLRGQIPSREHRIRTQPQAKGDVPTRLIRFVVGRTIGCCMPSRHLQSADYPEGVGLHSPGSRSAPWVTNDRSARNLKGFYNELVLVVEPFQGSVGWANLPQGALRDPGLWSGTLSGFLSQGPRHHFARRL